MTIKLSSNAFSYLQQNFKTEIAALQREIANAQIAGQFCILDLDEDFAIQIRDWAGETLQVIGFDKNYELTKEGVILEEIIDNLFR